MAKFAILNFNGDFRALYHRGKSQVHPLLVTYVLRQSPKRGPRRGPGMAQKVFPRLPGETRVGITTGRKSGNSVQRSRCRRIIREAYRSLRPRVASGWDIVFVARAATCSAKSHVLQKVMARHLTALKLLNPCNPDEKS